MECPVPERSFEAEQQAQAGASMKAASHLFWPFLRLNCPYLSPPWALVTSATGSTLVTPTSMERVVRLSCLTLGPKPKNPRAQRAPPNIPCWGWRSSHTEVTGLCPSPAPPLHLRLRFCLCFLSCTLLLPRPSQNSLTSAVRLVTSSLDTQEVELPLLGNTQ